MKGKQHTWDEGRLQAYLDDELPPEERLGIEAALEHSSECQETLSRLQEEQDLLWQSSAVLLPETAAPFDQKEILERFAQEEQSIKADAQIASREGAPPKTVFSLIEFWKGWTGQFALAGAATAALLLVTISDTWQTIEPVRRPVRQSPSHTGEPIPDATRQLTRRTPIQRPIRVPDRRTTILRIKGIHFKMLHSRRLKSGTFSPSKATKSGIVLVAGDLLQFTYHFPKRLHLIIGGINQQGETFPLVVSKKGESIQPKSLKGAFPNSRAFKLDKYIGKERYFAVSSPKAFTWKALQKILKKRWQKDKALQHPFKLPKPWQIRSFLIIKKAKSASKSTP